MTRRRRYSLARDLARLLSRYEGLRILREGRHKAGAFA